MVEPTKELFSVVARPGPLDARTARDVRDLAARAASSDGVAPLSEQPLLWLTSAEAPVVHLVAYDGWANDDAPDDAPDDDGGDVRLVGYAQVDVGTTTTARAELVVDPDHRRVGVGRALLSAAHAEAALEPGRRLHVWAHGDLPDARTFSAATAMAVVRELWQMRLDLTVPAPAPRPLPAGVVVRTFVPGQDEEAWRRVNSRAFAHHPEQGRISKADLVARESEPWFDPAGFLLAERDGKLLGSVWTKVHPAGEHGPAPVGEIYVVGVDPDAQGLGLGGALTDLGLAHLRERGLTSALLYTGAENTVAIRTYRSVGFERSAVDVMFGPDTQGSPAGATMAP
ncbi:mycothiol synthase [Cellulomonas composti]|uniref:Mycothiol acetyltransferase n=1 Tax=Cellulomonas composti TaxID=266130 RepID=A0A511JCQ9_9CELL|nr:mycothiol synthase [Cellulomonas composti]GEL95775.1 mycothiol acetyltransferase [Cellulomonas composti]